jgi:hypothetical protein
MHWAALLLLCTSLLDQRTGVSSFVGTWKLLSYEQRRPNGEVVYPRGRDPLGVLMYDRNGRMSVQIMARDWLERPADYVQKASPEELRATLTGYSAYFGTYEVNLGGGYVVHHVQGSIHFSYLHTDQKRFFAFQGKHLTLTLTSTVEGETRTSRLLWERAD